MPLLHGPGSFGYDFLTKKQIILSGHGWGRLPLHMICDELNPSALQKGLKIAFVTGVDDDRVWVDKYTVYQALDNIIQNAIWGNATELDLSYKRLTSLPPEIGKLTHLKKLDLSINQLST